MDRPLPCPFSRRHALSLGLAIAGGVVLPRRASGAAPTKRPLTVAEANGTLARLKPLHTVMGPAQEGEWLKTHPEKGQTFAQFLKARPRRAIEKYTRLYLQPLGDFSPAQEKVLAATADAMQRFFGLTVVTNKRLPLDDLPTHARREHPSWKVPQILSTYILDKVLKPRCPRDAAALLALTASDLWPGEGWNFVFGQASLGDRVGVWSIYRNGQVDGTEDEQRQFLRRTLKTAIHETGHMFGIPHCILYECGMNGSNSLEEADGRPWEFCPQCQAKIWWTCGVDPRARCQALLEFAEQHKLDKEAAFWKKSLAVLP